MAMNEIAVTIICLAYNHARYIRDALDGFLMQETSFPFEVIVHDDASTDGTADIIREYQLKRPDIIKTVFQKENQYSKGKVISRDFLFPMIRGKYVALCEGDDYWTDPRKLQKQVEALEAHPEADICGHRALRRNKGRFDGWIAAGFKSRLIPIEEVILGGGGWFCSTCSLMLRKEAYLAWTPMREVIAIDYVLALQGALRGGMVYLDDSMSVYRINTEGSWTSQNIGESKVRNREQMIQLMSALDSYTEGKYSETIRMRAEMFRSDLFRIKRDWRSLYSLSRLEINWFRLRIKLKRIAWRWLSFL